MSAPAETPALRSLLDLTGRVALVTGAGSGLGRAVAARFAEAGASVIVHHRQSAEGARSVVRAVETAGGRALAVQGDLAREEDASRVVAAAVEAFGRLDVLINNAGIYPVAGLLEMTAGQWDETMAATLRQRRPVHAGGRAADGRPGSGRRGRERHFHRGGEARQGTRPLRRGQGGPGRLHARGRARARARTASA